MKCLSIRAPWWWWIVYGDKDIENRDWPTSYRGPVLIHASKYWRPDVREDHLDAKEITRADASCGAGWTFGKMRELGGNVVGMAEIVDCIDASDSPWFVGKFGFVLRNRKPIKPFPVRGSLGLFNVDWDAREDLDAFVEEERRLASGAEQ